MDSELVVLRLPVLHGCCYLVMCFVTFVSAVLLLQDLWIIFCGKKKFIGFVGDLDPILGLDIGICSIGMRSNMSCGECT